jgi:hypothetical protein
MIPTTLKDWNFVKTKVHDLSGIQNYSPEIYYYQLNNGVYYPAVRVIDMMGIPEPTNKKRI